MTSQASEVRRPSRAWLGRTGRGGALTGAAVAMVWSVSLPRVIVTPDVDAGTFLSVAERLRAGDRLYTEVWDNKDPLYYYLIALARSVTDLGETLLELGWLVLACGAVAVIARHVGLAGRSVTLVAWAATPLVLLGSAYFPGMSHLPGNAVMLGLTALALTGRWRATGAALAALALLKLVLLPMALALVAVALVPGSRARGTRDVLLGLVAVTAPFALLMAVRGELAGYLTVQLENVGHAQGARLMGSWSGPVGHLLRVAPEDGAGGFLITAATLSLALALGAPRPMFGRSAGRAPLAVLAQSAAAAAVAAGLVVGLTGLWVHHTQALYVPGVLAVVVLTAAAPGRAVASTPGRQVAVLLLAAYLVGGATHFFWYYVDAKQTRTALTSLNGPSVEAQALLAVAPTGRYARLGANDFTAHARGLGSWTLGCSHFHQYPMQSTDGFGDLVPCLSGVDAVLVDESFVPEPDAPDWNALVQEARTVVDRDFSCRPISTGEVCTRR